MLVALSNPKGQTLLGAIIGVAIAAAGMVAIMSYVEFGSRSINNLKYRMDADNFNEEIRALLSSPAACSNSFLDLSSDPSQSHNIALLRDGTPSPGATKYALGQIYGDQSLKLTAMTLGNFIAGDIPTKAQGVLTLAINAQKDGQGAQSVARSVALSLDIDPGTKKIVSCIAMAKMSDGIWRRGTTDLNTSYFSGGNVGIGSSAPVHPLDIVTTNAMNRTVTITNYGSDPNPWGGAFIGSFSRGTPASPLSVKAGDSLTVIGGNGFDGSNFAPAREAPGMYINASENWSSGRHGSTVAFRTVDNEQDNATAKMFIDQNGYIGIGTTKPDGPLRVVSATQASQVRFGVTNAGGGVLTSAGPGQASLGAGGESYDGVSTWTARTTSVSIFNSFEGTLRFYADSGLTVGSTFTPTQRMVIDSSGKIGVGMPNPQYTLDVNGSARATGNVVAWSDARVKKNIRPLENSLERVLKLDGVSFDWRRDEFPDKKFKYGRDVGVIAQNVETQFPEIVETGEDGYKSVAYPKLVAPLIEAIKTLHHRLLDIEAENAVKDGKIRDLEQRLESVEKALSRKP